MHRILVFSKFSTKGVEKLIRQHGMTPVRRRPDVVICWGGDGTFLLAEHKLPGIPKAIVRKDSICKKCQGVSLDELLKILGEKTKIPTQGFSKIQSEIIRKGKVVRLPLATNDVVVRNALQMHALRFSVVANNIKTGRVIGDGVVVSTPFGSSAYFKSITRKIFKTGLGVGFSNPVDSTKPIYLKKGKIVLRVERGDATVSIDTLSRVWKLRTGDYITMRESSEKGLFVSL